MRRLAFFVVLALLAACSAEGDRPGLIVTPGMAYSVPYDPYDPNEVLPGGQTLQPPPEGTAPVGGEAFFYGPGRDEAERAGRELANPLPRTDAVLARGAKVYQTFCAVCHGTGGQGDGPIIGRFPNPPSLLADRARSLPDGALYHVITMGQGIMAPYPVQVRPDDRWAVIHHIRSLQGGSP